jgi:hypothetical protein
LPSSSFFTGEIRLGKLRPGAALDRLGARGIEDDLLQHLRPAAGGKPIAPCIISTTLLGKFSFRRGSSTSMRRQAVGHHEQRHIADDLARRRHLHDVAEDFVHLRVHVRDFVPAVFQAQALGLLAQIGVLPAGHFVVINLGRAGLDAFLKRIIMLADGFPVIAEPIQRIQIQPAIARRALQRRDQLN